VWQYDRLKKVRNTEILLLST